MSLRRRVGPRRQMEWCTYFRTAGSVSGLITVNLVTPLETLLGRLLGDFTVTRMIISLWFQGGVALGEWAAGVVCDDRASPIKDPVTGEQLHDWMWIEKFVSHGDVLERASASWSVGGPYQNIYRDLGSQRKCNYEEAPHLAMKNVTGTASIVGGSVRTLVKLA